MTSASFEREVQFPPNPYEATFVFFGLMAYPEQGSGQIGGSGCQFATALADYTLWATKRARGIRFLREGRSDSNFEAPRKRQFAGTIDRGRRRIDRRIAAYDLFGSQLLTAFCRVRMLGDQAVREGRGQEAFYSMPNGELSCARPELWARATPSPRQMISRSINRWSRKFGLNRTGCAADAAQKAKDLERRAFHSSIPVLHMTHAFVMCAEKHGPEIGGWGQRDPVLAMMMNAEKWIWEAIDIAERWRCVPHLGGFDYLRKDRMVCLIRPQFDEGGSFGIHC